MTSESRQSEFFVAGGTLLPRVPSYVDRPADDELLRFASQGEFCYVLTPRQMGKSSLMVRTARRLEAQGIKTAIVDLTQIGTMEADTWYFDFLSELVRFFRLSVDLEAWWEQKSTLGAPSRFRSFLRDVLLTEVDEQIVIFVDEIDFTLKLDFSDDFFAAIRSIYNSRSQEIDFNRISFVLLGVASPADLIKERGLTPFNIGKGVLLHDFEIDDAGVLIDRLETHYQGQGQSIFERIYLWTGGHPYLTQKVCQVIDTDDQQTWAAKEIDLVIAKLFLDKEASKESNLEFVRDRLLKSPKRRQLLTLYRRIYSGKAVVENSQSVEQNQLKLAGLIKGEDETLQVRNKIYRTVFNLAWIKANTAIDWNRVVAVTAVGIITIGLFVVGHNWWVGRQIDDAKLAFYQTTNSDNRLEQLSIIADPPRLWKTDDSYGFEAAELFYGLSGEEQRGLFRPDYGRHISQNTDNHIAVIEAIYGTLADVDGNNDNGVLLDEISGILEQSGPSGKTLQIKLEIDAWQRARKFVHEGDFQQAIKELDTAVSLNPLNPSTRFERAKAFIKLGEYEQALADLDQIIGLSQNLPVMTPTPTATMTSTSIPPTPRPMTEIPGATETTGDVSPSPSKEITPSPQYPEGDPQSPADITFSSKFRTEGDIRSAVRILIEGNADFALFLASTPENSYANLRTMGLLPQKLVEDSTVTRTPISLQTPTNTNTPESIPTIQTIELTRSASSLPRATINSGPLRMREGPGAIYPVITIYAQGTSVELLGASLDLNWVKTRMPDAKEGWISESFLDMPVDIKLLLTLPAPPTPTPTPTETPTKTPVDCQISVDSELRNLWDRDILGCAVRSRYVVWSSYTPYQYGFMIWREDTRIIYGFFNQGNSWTSVYDGWTDGMNIPSRNVSPPPGYEIPVRGPGYIWATNDTFYQNLGFAAADQIGFCATIQDFERGTLMRTNTTQQKCSQLFDHLNPATYESITEVFLRIVDNGTWSRIYSTGLK